MPGVRHGAGRPARVRGLKSSKRVLDSVSLLGGGTDIGEGPQPLVDSVPLPEVREVEGPARSLREPDERGGECKVTPSAEFSVAAHEAARLGGRRLVRLVRGEGRDLSGWYGERGGGGGGFPWTARSMGSP